MDPVWTPPPNIQIKKKLSQLNSVIVSSVNSIFNSVMANKNKKYAVTAKKKKSNQNKN
jgi:hypothetical protein